MTATSPADCALIVTIPLERADFLAALNDPAKDFARQFQRERRNLTSDSLWKAYEPSALLVNDVCHQASCSGVLVIRNARLDDLHAQINKACGSQAYTNRVTTLIAHWRSALFRPEDVVGPNEVARYLNSASHEKPELANALNKLLNSPDRRFDDVVSGSAGEISAKQLKWHLRRFEMAAALGHAITGGAGIEFADGLHPLPLILAPIPDEYVGVLDLTVCQSVVFGEAVRARCPKCLVLSSANLTSLDFRLALYAQIVDVLRREPQPFENAVIKIRRSLINRYASRKTDSHR